MKETGRVKAAAGTMITYKLSATGFAPGTRLTLLRWPLNKGITSLMNGIVIDASGNAVCGEPVPAATANAPAAPGAGTDASGAGSSSGSAQDAAAIPSCTKTMKANDPVEVTTTAAKGEAIRLALVADDRKSGAATSMVPFPIEGKDKACMLQVLLGARDAELVLVEGDGFDPNVPFTLGSETFGVKSALSAKPDAKGHLVAAVTPYVAGHDSGDTVIYYQSDACTPTLSFHWGKDNYKAE
jgi:hypothetical protein